MFKEEGYSLMGTAFEVYNQLGYGMAEEVYQPQLFNYMRIARQSIGYLINFGRKGELQWKRFILSDLHEETEGNANLP